jgi:iron complex transport system ATP-binding protein
MPALLTARDISFSYADALTLLDVNLELTRGSLRALIGPNGSGKTTLLKLLAGILTPTRGAVEWNGADLKTFARRHLARHIALVPQELNLAFGFTVREMVLLGRTPHIGAFGGPTRRDHEIVNAMMKLAEVEWLAERYVTELSGGEKQRVVIAMALAQILDLTQNGEAQVLLLDEPTVHLDINHQIELLELLRRLNRERALTVLATMHDLNLAALYFDELALLQWGRVAANGAPAQVLTAERIQNVFGTPVRLHPHPTRPDAPQIDLLPTAT